jgi:hypothetical protein
MPLSYDGCIYGLFPPFCKTVVFSTFGVVIEESSLFVDTVNSALLNGRRLAMLSWVGGFVVGTGSTGTGTVPYDFRVIGLASLPWDRWWCRVT